MPNIREYKNKINGLELDDRASRSAADAARTAEWAGNDVGRSIASVGRDIETGAKIYEEHQARQEISRGMPMQAHLNETLSDNWDSTRSDSDINDPTVANGWREETLEPTLEGWVDSFQTEKGKAWAQAQANQLRQHYHEKTAADEISAAGAAASQNILQTRSSWSNTAYKDPTQVDMLLGANDSMIDTLLTMHPNLTEQQKAQIKGPLRDATRKEILVSGFQGMAQRNPQAALSALDAGYGSTDLDGTDRNTLRNQAIQQQKAHENDAKAAQTAAEKERKDRMSDLLSQITATTINPKDGSLRIGPGYFKAVADPRLDITPAERRAAIDYGRSVQKDLEEGTKATTDPHTYEDFGRRMLLPEGDPNSLSMTEVYNARAQGMLSDKDFTFFKQSRDDLLKDPAKVAAQKDFHDFTSSFKSTLTHSDLTIVDGIGDQKYYQFQTWAQDYHEREKAGGMPEERIRQNIRARVPDFAKATTTKDGLLVNGVPIVYSPYDPNKPFGAKPPATPPTAATQPAAGPTGKISVGKSVAEANAMAAPKKQFSDKELYDIAHGKK